MVDPFIPLFDLIGTVGFLLAMGIGMQNYRDTEIAQVFWMAFTFTAGLGAIWLGLVTLEWMGVQSVLLNIFSTSLQAVVIGVFAVASIGSFATVEDLKQSRSEIVQQRRQAEAAKRQAETRKRDLERTQKLLHEVEEMASVGGWEYTSETKSFRVTGGIRSIVKMTPDDFTELCECFHPEDADAFREAVETCKTERTPFDLELRVISATGKKHWVHARGSLVEYRGSIVIRGVIQEVSGRKEREQRLMVLNRVLRHDLRNKLTVILGHTTELEKSLEGLDSPPAPVQEEVREQLDAPSRSTDDPPDGRNTGHHCAGQLQEFSPAEFREHVRHIRESAVAVSSLSEKVHDFQKATRAERQPREVEIEPIAERVKMNYANRFPDATIELRGTEVSVWGFSEGIRLMLEELVENAIVHNDQGDPAVIIEGATPSEHRVHLRVKDTGPGLPPAEREVLATGEETPLSHGSGIGLWTVHWIMSRYGGSVKLQDNEPSGTIVEMTFSGSPRARRWKD